MREFNKRKDGELNGVIFKISSQGRNESKRKKSWVAYKIKIKIEIMIVLLGLSSLE